MNAWLPLAALMLGTGSVALAQSIPVSEQLSPGGDGVVVPAEPISSGEPSGLVTVESDLQQADTSRVLLQPQAMCGSHTR